MKTEIQIAIQSKNVCRQLYIFFGRHRRYSSNFATNGDIDTIKEVKHTTGRIQLKFLPDATKR